MTNHWARPLVWGFLIALLLLGLLPGVHAALSDGLVMRLHLDEGSGTTAGDTSGRDNNGTITASPTWRTTCKVGGCLRFNGTGAYINVTRSPTLNMSGNLTILLWFNETTAQTGGFVVKMKNAPDSGYRLIAESGTYIAGTLYTSSQAGVGSGVLSPITLNRWTHAALNYNGSFLALFINGSRVDAQAASGAVGLNTQDVMIGQYEPGSGLFYAGEMDEIYIWNRSLSQAEHAYMYVLLTVSAQSPANTTYATTSVWVNVTLNMDDGNVTAQLDGSTNYSLTNSSGNWNYQMTGLGQGTHNVQIFANDSLGNMNSSQIVYFTVDNIAPVVTLIAPANNSDLFTPRNLFNFTFTDNSLNTTSNFTFYLDGVANFTGTIVNATYNLTNLSVPVGSHNWSVNVSDGINTGTSGWWYFNIRPNLTIILYDEVTEAAIAGTGKTTNVTLRDPNTYATNTTLNATNGSVTFAFIGVNETAWVVDAGLASTDYPYPRLTVVTANQSSATVYLIPITTDPAFVVFVLNDITGGFAGSLLQVKKNINGSQVELSRMNFDIEDKATAWMILNNRYLLFIDNGKEVRSLGFFVPIGNATKTIVLGNVSLAPVSYSSWKDIVINLNSTNASDGSGTIFWRWNDTLNQTTAVEFFIYNGTNETASQAYYVGSNASVFSTTYQGINNTNLTYLVRWKAVHSRFGTIEGRQLVIFFNTQKRVNLGVMATEPWHYLAFGIILVIILAGLFNAKNAALGGMVVVGAIILLNYWGWMQTSGIIVGTLAIVALVGKLKEGKA